MTAPDHDFRPAVEDLIGIMNGRPATRERPTVGPSPLPRHQQPAARAAHRAPARRPWRERVAALLDLGDLYQLGRHRRARVRMGAAAARSRGTS